MKKILYRSRQFIFSVFVRLIQNKKTELIRGENSILKVPNLLMEDGVNKVLIVTTPGFIKRKSLDELFTSFKDANIDYSIYTNVNPDPTVEDVEGGVKIYINENCQGIVAIGGGSVLDCAKIIGARVSNPKTSVRSMRGMLKIKKELPPYYPCPTTCGTGSEVTAAAVITDTIEGKHYKYAITDLKLIPKKAILDAGLLKTLPPFMLLTTSMDALTHSLEAYVNLYGTKEVSDDSKESIRLIFNNIDGALKGDINAIDKLLYASTLAGIAITHNFVGYVHAIAHAIGALYGLPHGYLNSIILPVILKRFGHSIDKKMEELCVYLGVETSSPLEKVISLLNEIKEKGNLPFKIRELKESDFDEIIYRANKESNPTYPVPVIFNKKDFIEILSELVVK